MVWSAAEKIVLWDSWLRGKSPKAIWRAFGKPSSLFIASWPPVLRRPAETTSESGQTQVKLVCPLSATTGLMHCNISTNRKTASRRSLRKPIRCLDQAAAITPAFLRFLRQPSRPIAPIPVAKSGRAAGSGVMDAVKVGKSTHEVPPEQNSSK